MSTLDPGVQPDHQDAVAAGDQGDAAGGWRGQVREAQLHYTQCTVNLTPLWATRGSKFYPILMYDPLMWLQNC